MNIPFVPLRKLLELHDSGVWGPEDQSDGISVLRSTNFSSDGSIRFENLTYRSVEPSKRESKRLLELDIILEKSGGGPKQPVGRVCLFRGHEIAHAFGNFTARLRVKKSLVNPEYLFWYLRYLHLSGVTLRYQEHTSGIRNLDTKRYLDHPISLPPLEEQRRIVGFLNRTAKLKRLRKQAQERLREFIPALFTKMFGDPADNPMGWKVRPLGALCIQTQYGTSKRATDKANGLPVLRMGNVTYSGDLDCTNLKWVALSENDTEKYLLRKGDILFNRTNSKELVGKTGVWDGRFDAVAASYFIRLRVDENSVCPIYVWAFMNSAATKQRLFATARGAIGQANINAEEVKSLSLPVPPLDLQRTYSELAEKAQSELRTTESCCVDVFELQGSLMSRFLDIVA